MPPESSYGYLAAQPDSPTSPTAVNSGELDAAQTQARGGGGGGRRLGRAFACRSACWCGCRGSTSSTCCAPWRARNCARTRRCCSIGSRRVVPPANWAPSGRLAISAGSGSAAEQAPPCFAGVVADQDQSALAAVGLGRRAAPFGEHLQIGRDRTPAEAPSDRVGAGAFEHDQDDVALVAGDDRRRRRLGLRGEGEVAAIAVLVDAVVGYVERIGMAAAVERLEDPAECFAYAASGAVTPPLSVVAVSV